MAIKPTDTIIPYDELVTWENEETPHYRRAYKVEYLKNFHEYVDELYKNMAAEYVKNKERIRFDLSQTIFVQELGKFNAMYKYKPNGKSYIKFKTASDLTYFVLRWS